MHLYMLHSACVLCIDIMGMLPNLIESCFSKCTSSISSMDEGNDWKLEQCKSKSIMQIKHCREEVVRATLQKEQTFGKRNHKLSDRFFVNLFPYFYVVATVASDGRDIKMKL